MSQTTRAVSTVTRVCAVVSFVLLGFLEARAASLIGTTSTPYGFESASRFYVHFANDRYWAAFHNGVAPVLYSSPDGVSWTSQGNIFSSFNPLTDQGHWAVRFQGNNMIALAFDAVGPPADTRKYRNGVLNSTGTISWNAADVVVGPSGISSWDPLNALIANGRPIMWRADAGGEGMFRRGSQLNAPAWADSTDAPSVTTASNGFFGAGAVFPTGGADPDDLIVVRATSNNSYVAGRHRLIAIRYDALVAPPAPDTNPDPFAAAWYNVSTLNGTIGGGETSATEVKEATLQVRRQQFAAVRDTTGNVHAVFVNGLSDVAHYRKAVGFNDSWTRPSADVTQSAAIIDRVALAAVGGDNLFLFYSKSDAGIYFRRWNGAAWGAEATLKSASGTALQGALATFERSTGCPLGVGWTEGGGPSYDVMFSFVPGSCQALTASAAGSQVTVETSDVRMVWDAAGMGGGGLNEFYGKTEPNSGVNRSGSTEKYNLFSTQVNDTTEWYFEGWDGSAPGSGRAGNVVVLEATKTRVKLRQNHDYRPTIHLQRDWSVYAHPRLAIDETLTIDAGQTMRGAQGLHPKGDAVCGNTFFCAGISSEANGIWVATDDALTYSDMLGIAQATPFFGRGGTGYAWQSNLEGGAPDSWLARTWEANPVLTPMVSDRRFYLVYPYLAGLTSGGSEWVAYADDYRLYDATFNASVGSGWEDPGEKTAAGDFYNEAEAAYLVDFDPTTGLSFDIDGNPTTRRRPFFKIRQWRSLVDPPSVTLEGTALVNDVDYKADVKPFARAFHCTGPFEFDGCSSLANGGLAGTSEYLNDTSAPRNYTLAFPDVSTWLYLGAESRFRGINVRLATAGIGNADLLWEYWNGAGWLLLEGSTGWSDGTNNLKKSGTISWGSDSPEIDPIGWAPRSINGSPSLYFVRASLQSGSYSTPPVELLVKTDILLFQYCGDIVALNDTFVFSLPTPTAVTLEFFSATAFDSAAELSWRTASELSNLGFHVYRAMSADGPWTRLTASLIPGLGSSAVGQGYTFRDAGLTNGTRYYYRLEDVDAASKSTSHGPVSAVPTAGASAGDSGRDGSRDKKKGSASSSCPDWVLAAYGSAFGADAATASLRCTRHGDPEASSLGVLSRDSRQATLELRTGGFYALHEASGTVRVFVPGFDFPQDEKAAALPIRRGLTDAVVGRRVRLGGVRALDLASFRGLVPSSLGKAEMQVGWDGTVRAARRGSRPLARQFPKGDLVTLLPSLFQGEQKSAVVEIAPLRFDAQRRQLVLAKRVRVKLLFTGREVGESGRGSLGRAQGAQKPADSGEILARLYTTSAGLHAVSFEQLLPGRRRVVAVSELRLERQGEAVGFHAEPSTGSFGPGSRLFFYADRTASSTDFSAEVAYELVRGAGGVVMPLLAAAPGASPVASASLVSRSFEVNRLYQPGLLDAPDPWLWEPMASGATRVKSFVLSGVSGSRDAELDVFVQGASESGQPVDHHVSVSLNGTLVGEARFAGKNPYQINLSLPAALLREGSNELSLTNVADTGVASLVFLDRFTLAHPQASSLVGGRFEGTWRESGTAMVAGASGALAVLDVTPEGASAGDDGAGSSPRWLTGYQLAGGSLSFQVQAGRRYLVAPEEALLAPRVAAPEASTLRARTNQADYILVAPRAFLAAAEPLVQRRQDQGLTTRAVSFEEVAAEFGHGQPSAEAIKAFLGYAFHSWARPSPRYVLLLGDASYDPRNFIGSSQPAPLPALWTKTSYLWTVSDPQLAAVNGEDSVPDLAIGRLPAATVEQAQALVAKLLAWEDSGQGLAGQAALVADNPDVAGDFEANARDIAQSYLSDRSAELLALSELGAETRPAILDALNSGLSFLNYVGHGGAAVWASENVWNSWDAPSLMACSQQPLLVTMNCLNGYFVAPSFDSLSESLLKAEGRGAIASFSPSGLSLDGPAHQYHRALMAELTSGKHATLGDAILAAQKAYAGSGLMPELLGIYHLLGDPATSIR